MTTETEIQFEEALAIVKKRMIEGVKEIQAAGNERARVSIAIGSSDFQLDWFASGDSPHCSMAQSISEAIAKVPKKPSRESEIERLRKELAELESEHQAVGKAEWSTPSIREINTL